MVGPGEVDPQLDDEVGQECTKYGAVQRWVGGGWGERHEGGWSGKGVRWGRSAPNMAPCKGGWVGGDVCACIAVSWVGDRQGHALEGTSVNK